MQVISWASESRRVVEEERRKSEKIISFPEMVCQPISNTDFFLKVILDRTCDLSNIMSKMTKKQTNKYDITKQFNNYPCCGILVTRYSVKDILHKWV